MVSARSETEASANAAAGYSSERYMRSQIPQGTPPVQHSNFATFN